METKAIPDKLYYKASEVCQITDTQPYVLRFWESEFPQIASEKNRAGQRVYRKEDIDLILRIKKLLYEEEYTIASARRAIEGNEATIVEDPPVRPKRPPVTVAREILDDDPIVVPTPPPASAPSSLFEGRERSAETTEAAAVEVATERAAHHAALTAIDDLKRELMALTDARDKAVGRRDEALNRCRRVAEKLRSVLESSPSI